MGTLSICHNEGVDDVNETIELDHDVEGMEEVPNIPRDIPEALNKESEGSKPNIEETEVINLADEGKTEKPVKVGVNFPKDMKDELIALLKESKEIFAWSYQDMLGLDTEIIIHKILVKHECPTTTVSPLKDKVRDYPEDKKRSRKVIESRFSYCNSLF